MILSPGDNVFVNALFHAPVPNSIQNPNQGSVTPGACIPCFATELSYSNISILRSRPENS
jgi:hypothetical protein